MEQLDTSLSWLTLSGIKTWLKALKCTPLKDTERRHDLSVMIDGLRLLIHAANSPIEADRLERSTQNAAFPHKAFFIGKLSFDAAQGGKQPQTMMLAAVQLYPPAVRLAPLPVHRTMPDKDLFSIDFGALTALNLFSLNTHLLNSLIVWNKLNQASQGLNCRA